jgi:hypothetical protein
MSKQTTPAKIKYDNPKNMTVEEILEVKKKGGDIIEIKLENRTVGDAVYNEVVFIDAEKKTRPPRIFFNDHVICTSKASKYEGKSNGNSNKPETKDQPLVEKYSFAISMHELTEDRVKNGSNLNEKYIKKMIANTKTFMEAILFIQNSFKAKATPIAKKRPNDKILTMVQTQRANDKLEMEDLPEPIFRITIPTAPNKLVGRYYGKRDQPFDESKFKPCLFNEREAQAVIKQTKATGVDRTNYPAKINKQLLTTDDLPKFVTRFSTIRGVISFGPLKFTKIVGHSFPREVYEVSVLTNHKEGSRVSAMNDLVDSGDYEDLETSDNMTTATDIEKVDVEGEEFEQVDQTAEPEPEPEPEPEKPKNKEPKAKKAKPAAPK